MSSPSRKGFWPRARRLARWLRTTCLSLVLLVLGGLLYLNRIGLPAFLRARLVAELRQRGLDLHFRRMRLHWYGGIVAEDLNLGRANHPFGPQIFIDLAEVRLDPRALGRFRLKVDSLRIRRARVVWPLSASGEPSHQLSLDDLATDLRFLPNDQWELDQCHARCLGADIHLLGTLTNASHLRDWQMPAATNPAAAARLHRLDHFVALIQKVKFRAPPQVRVQLQGDARNPATFNARLMVSAAAATGFNGALQDALLIARINQPPVTHGPQHATVRFRAQGLRLPWGTVRDCYSRVDLTYQTAPGGRLDAAGWVRCAQVRSPWGTLRNLSVTGKSQRTAAGRFTTTLDFDPGRVQSRWGSARGSRLRLEITASSPNHLAQAHAEAQLQTQQVETPWGNGHGLQVSLRIRGNPPTGPPAGAAWGGWARLQPFDLEWDARLQSFQSRRLTLRQLYAAGEWRAPDLTVHQFQAALYAGQFNAAAELNVATREARVRGDLDFDLHRIEDLLTAGGRHWLGEFAWKTAPAVQAEARAILPPWPDAHPDWRATVLPTLTVTGHFTCGPGAYRGVSVSAATSHFSFVHSTWSLGDLEVIRPEGRSALQYRINEATHDFHWTVDGHFDPGDLAPLLTGAERRGLDLFQFTTPPAVQGEVWGRLHVPDRLGFRARVGATNLVFRGEPFSRLASTVEYTNHCFTMTQIHIGHGAQHVFAPGVRFDLDRERLSLTNALAVVDPMLVARAIGPKPAHSLAPYHFANPPTAQVNGSLRVHSPEQPDMRFDLDGGPFRYWRFDLPRVSATVHWLDHWVILTNLDAAFYGGRLRGNAGFDFSAPREADFHFHAVVTDANLKALLADLSPSTNKLEGSLNGDLTITSANTGDWGSWNGFGDLSLHDGYLWNLPLFGILSPALDAVIPGLGRSRFTEGSANFTITNSVIQTDNLETRAPALQLRYRGTVDFQGRLDARVEASLLRNTGLVGQLFSLALSPITKILEYKVSGTLQKPQRQPLYLPKFLFMPLHPFRTLKDLFGAGSTNAPPPPKPSPSP